MGEYGFNNKYLTLDNRPWFPVMGEIHYSRVRYEDWQDELYKMKAGNVSVVSTYVIWIHHEEIEKEYDFTGNKNLHEFVKKIQEAGLKMILRIGPWSHAEVRNGGFPDWLLNKEYEPRTNDERYFEEVRRFYNKIYEQVAGLLHKDGGPIIGVQIENEYGHCGGLTGDEGELHMQTLTKIAKEAGFDVPLYTATGWGGAMTGGLIPVMGGYCEAPWDQRLTDIEPSGNYVFTHERNDHNIGSDFGFADGITFDIDKFPFLTAELGGGLQVTHHRRPVATASDIGAMTMVKLGCGVNLLGYYMYHGGTNPTGKLSTLQESKATGSWNDLPIYSYDFRAPIREFGQISDTFKEIKLFTYFAKEFEEEFCKMDAHIPDSNPTKPTNLTDYRISVRDDGKSGYVFINNYQRRYDMQDHKDVAIKVNIGDEVVEFPKIDICNKDYYYFPINMRLGNEAIVKKSLLSPLLKLNNDITTYVFYDNNKGDYMDIEGELKDCNIVKISRKEALNAYKIVCDKEYLFISESPIIDCGQSVKVVDTTIKKIKVYPKPDFKISNYEYSYFEDGFAVYKFIGENTKEFAKPLISFELSKKEAEYEEYTFNVKDYSGSEDALVELTYYGDRAELYIDDKLVGDNYYLGDKYDISMKYYNFPDTFKVRIYPLMKEQKLFLEKWPKMENDSICEIVDVKIVNEHRISIIK